MKSRSFWGGLLLLSVVAALFSLWAGAVSIPWDEILRLLTGSGGNPVHETILRQIRLPRTLLGLVTGACLGASGCAFQAVLRNPLADPYLLGISGGGALAGVVAMALGFGSRLALPLAALVGALAALAMVYAVAQAHHCSSTTLILSGVMVGSFASALLLLVLWHSPLQTVRSAVFWLGGDLSTPDQQLLLWGGIVAVALFFGLQRLSPALDLMTLGEETAADLGLAVGRYRLLTFILAGSLTALAVALAGMVGFVGLVAPHAVRLTIGPAHSRLLPGAALCGGCFLVLADGLSRWLLAPAELPIGVVTALFGAPFFLYLLRRGERP
ncbi:MAG: iron ABC transporter permease [Deltaproteobacteria bacterium]|nr:iron ABC transporter permease [Deltaproteobacteria bacterium]